MANQVPRGRGSRPKRKPRQRARRRVELVALTQTSRCGTAAKKGGLRTLFRVGLLVALLLAPILIAAGTLAGTTTLDPPPDSTYWTRHSTQTGGNPQHSGHVDIDLTKGVLERQWQRGGFEPILAGPVMDRENVYLVDRNGTVSALNLTTGDTAWTFDAKSPVSATPALAYGWLYVATEGKSVIALSARTGTEIVRATVSGAAKAPPVIAEGRVFQGTDSGTLHVLDATTLDELWKFDTATVTFTNGEVNKTTSDTKLRKPIRAAPAVYDGKVYLAGWNKRVYALSTTGNVHGNPETLHWTQTVSDIVSAAPAVDRHRSHLLVGTASGQLHALKLTGGSEAWKLDAGGSFHRGLAVSQERVVAATSDGRLVSVDAYGGALQWQRLDEAGYIAAPILTETLVLALTANGTIRLVHDASGDPYKADGAALEWQLPGGSHATPAVTTRGIVTVDQSGHVTMTGAPVPRVADLRAESVTAPANLSADESLVVGIAVRNNGPDASGPVTLRWSTDDGTSGQTTIEDITPGATHTGNLVLPPLPAATHTITFTYEGEHPDPTPADATTTVTWTLVDPLGTGQGGAASGAPGGAGDGVPLGGVADDAGLSAGFTSAWTGWMLPIGLLATAGAIAAARNRRLIASLLQRVLPGRDTGS